MRQRTELALVRVMACCLFGTKPLLEPMLTLLIEPLGTNFSEIQIKTKFFIHENAFENVVFEMAAILSRGRWVKVYLQMTVQSALICERWDSVLIVTQDLLISTQFLKYVVDVAVLVWKFNPVICQPDVDSWVWIVSLCFNDDINSLACGSCNSRCVILNLILLTDIISTYQT